MIPHLPARIHPIPGALLEREGLLETLTERWGSPLNLLFPEVFRGNVATLRQTLDRSGIGYRIHYAHKANQARCFVQAALAENIGIDVASSGELGSAREAGFPADRVEVTGPKGRDFLAVLVASGVTVNIDNLWELSQVVRLGRERNGRERNGCPARVPVLVRVCGFGPPRASGAQRVSRFGIPVAQFAAVLEDLAAGSDAVDFLGVSFHLDSGEARDKVQAVEACLNLIERSWSAGLTPHVLDVGGGFRQVFLDLPQALEDYAQAMKRGLTGQGNPLTWDGNTLGYRFQDGAIRGVPVFHKYANDAPGSAGLAEILDSPLPGHGGRTIARVLQENMIELWLEPGKALVDQAGLTVASVEFVKQAPDGSWLVNLDISRDKVCPADQEVMLDPVVIRRSAAAVPKGADGPAEKVGVFFAGNLCLERDMIFNHLTFVDRLPEPGDFVVFVNTAAYQMDLSASGALLQPLARKVVVSSDGHDGLLAFAADDRQEAVTCSTATSPS